MAHKALIIDDTPGNIEALAQLLALEGVESVWANSPRTIPASVKPGNIEVVFLDLEFPNDNGLQALQCLKADPRLEAARFVAYTVHTSEQNEAYSAGFDAFIGKPLSVERFPEQLDRILRGESVWEV